MKNAEELSHISRQIHEVDHTTGIASNRSQEAQARAEDITRSIDNRVQQTHLLVQSTEQSATSNALNLARVLQRLPIIQSECQASSQMLAEQNANSMTVIQRELQRLNETVRHSSTLMNMVSRSEGRANVHSYPNFGCY